MNLRHWYLKSNDPDEYQQETKTMRVREACPDCNFTSTLADMHTYESPDTE